MGVTVYEFVHFVQKNLFLAAALFSLGLQVWLCPFLQFVVDTPNGRTQASLFCKQIYDVESVELFSSLEILKNSMFAKYGTVFPIIVEFLKYCAILQEVFNCFMSCSIAIVKGYAVEQSLV